MPHRPRHPLFPLLLFTLFLASCDQHPVSIEKTLKTEDLARATLVYDVVAPPKAPELDLGRPLLNSILNRALAGPDSVTLTAHVTEPADDVVRPALIYVHGGAFVHGTTGVEDPTGAFVGEEFALRGYRTYAITYRSMNPLAPSFVGAGYMAAQDGQRALAYLLERHEELRIDPDNVFLMGYSAGGITALNTVFMDPSDAILGQEQRLATEYGPLTPLADIGGRTDPLAAVVSIAGGVLDVDVFDDTRVPLCLIHGTEDRVISPDCRLPLSKAAGLVTAGVELLSGVLGGADATALLAEAELPPICGSAAVAEFGKAAGMDLEYHPIQKGGHFLLLSTKGERTAYTEEVLGIMAEFLFGRLRG